ncbi:MAG: hypothetical protein PHU49_02020 [Syntrophorhabdaceae bacterium]|nr:hypothetical protein [Syntrophorhabdaceae bacterium]MDD5242769.1 hypothetical protein [Syntrophorhabdaceae bacterium]
MKALQEIATIRNLRSMHSIGARSIPKAQRSPYLDLYTLKKEKDRLEKETSLLEKKRKITGRLLSDVNKLIVGLQEEVRREREIKTIKHTKADPLKTMPIRY